MRSQKNFIWKGECKLFMALNSQNWQDSRCVIKTRFGVCVIVSHDLSQILTI